MVSNANSSRTYATPILLVQWETLEAHTEGFRKSEKYSQWKELLYHFYDPFPIPIVEHYQDF